MTVVCVVILATCGISTVLHLAYDEQCIGSDPPTTFGVLG